VSFFVGWSVVGILFGTFLFLTSSLAYLGIRYQSRKTGEKRYIVNYTSLFRA
jgi:hypothetical protein